MEHILTPEAHAGAYQMGTPHVLSLAPLIGSLTMFNNEVGMERIREKSLRRLTGYMMDLVEKELADYDFIIRNSKEDHRSWGHLLLEHKEAARICKALKPNNIIPRHYTLVWH